MSHINIHEYYDLADDIKRAQKRDNHLIAEWCLDIYPLYSFTVRQHVRKMIVNHLITAREQ